MKKVLLPFVAAALALGASAQLIPNTFNYQGVCAEKGTNIEINFEVLDSETFTVYQEVQNVATTDAGTFTAVIGKGTPTRGDWNDIDWTASEYSLVTYINGVKVGECAFQAVPYANVAAYVVGLDETQQDVLNLTEGNRENRAAIASLQADLANLGENIDALPGMFEYLEEQLEAYDQAIDYVTSDVQGIQESLRGKANVADVEALAEGLDITQQDVINLTEGNKENRSAIAELQQSVNLLYSENDGPISSLNLGFTMLNNLVTDVAAQVEENTEAIDIVSSDLQGVVEGMRGKANVADVEALAEGLDITQQDVINLTEGNKENRSAIAELQQSVNLLYSENDGPIASLNLGFTMLNNLVTDVAAQVEENSEAIDIVSSDLQGVVEGMRGKANVADVEALAEGLDITQQDVINLTEGNKENKAAIASIQADLANILENFQFLVPELQAIEETNAAQDEAIDIVSSDLQGLVEAMRGKANVADVEALAEGLDITQQDIINLTEGNKENKAAIASLKADLANLGENIDALPAYFEYIEGELANQADAIDIVSSDLQGVVEAMRGKANVEDVQANSEAIEALRIQIANNAAAIGELSKLLNK